MKQDMIFWRSAYDAHGPAVLAFLARRLGRREDAEDLLQETFVRAIGHGSFSDGNLRGYLLRIAHNLVINRLRRPRLVVPAHGDEPFEHVPAATASPEQEAAAGDIRQRLGGALERMSEAHRRAFELALLEGHSYAEVAHLTGWTLPQVKINVYRARKRVIEELSEHLPRTGRSRHESL